jgi:hypothetical protein
MRTVSGSRATAEIPASLKARLNPECSRLDDASLAEALRNMPGRYWPPQGARSEAFAARFPDEKKMLQAADLAALGRISFWHPWHMEMTHETAYVGRPIRWTRAPNGDGEWPHALARFSHMVDLAAAFSLTGKPDLLAAYGRYLESYLGSRPRAGRSGDPFWGNRLSSAQRLMNLIRSFDLLRDSGDAPAPLRLRALEGILEEGAYLAGGLGKHVGNWEFFICAALCAAVNFLSGRFAVDDWERAALARLDEVIASEVAADGTFSEQAPMYQGEVVLALLDGLQSYAANGRILPAAPSKAASGLLAGLVRMADPQGLIPPVGDSDRFPVGYLARYAGAVLGRPAPETVADAAGFINGNGNGNAQPSHFPDAQWAVVRWDLPGTAIPHAKAWLFFDASGKPAARRRFHSHADDLQFLLHASAGPIFTDPGRYTYAASFPGNLPFTGRPIGIYPRGRLGLVHDLLFPGLKAANERDWRAYFRGSPSHNTVCRVGLDQPGYGGLNPNGPDPRKVTLELPKSEGPMFLLAGEASTAAEPPAGEPTMETGAAGRAMAGDFRHRRIIAGSAPGLAVIVDEVVSEESGDWWVSFHLGPEVTVRVEGRSAYLGGPATSPSAASPSAEGIRIDFACSGTGMERFELAVVDDWVSPVYNSKTAAKTLRVKIGGATGFRLVTAVWMPDRVTSTLHPGIAGTSIREESGVVCLRREGAGPGGGFEARVNPEKRAYAFAGMQSDAAFATASWAEGRILAAAGFLQGTYLNVGDRILESGRGPGPHRGANGKNGEDMEKDGACYRRY